MVMDNGFQNKSAEIQAAVLTPRTPAQPEPQAAQVPAPAPASIPAPVPKPETNQLQAGQTQKPETKQEQKKENDLQSQYDRLNVRYKHIVEERDALARQVHELRRQIEGDSSCKHDTIEEIRLLNKLMDEEQKLLDEARKKGALPADCDLFARQDRFMNAYLSIISRGANKPTGFSK